MKVNGQTVEEAIEALSNLKGHGIVLTDYTMNAVTPDGNKLKLGYDVRRDSRFSRKKS